MANCEAVEALVKAGAEIDAKDVRNATALVFAVASDHANPKSSSYCWRRVRRARPQGLGSPLPGPGDPAAFGLTPEKPAVEAVRRARSHREGTSRLARSPAKYRRLPFLPRPAPQRACRGGGQGSSASPPITILKAAKRAPPPACAAPSSSNSSKCRIPQLPAWHATRGWHVARCHARFRLPALFSKRIPLRSRPVDLAGWHGHGDHSAHLRRTEVAWENRRNVSEVRVCTIGTEKPRFRRLANRSAIRGPFYETPTHGPRCWGMAGAIHGRASPGNLTPKGPTFRMT